MMETLELGSSPSNEDCAQVGTDDYQERERVEIKAYINQLKRHLIAEGFADYEEYVTLKKKGCPHDFGTYYEVAVKYDESVERAVEIAYWLEGNLPLNWDKEAIAELGDYYPPLHKLKAQAKTLGYDIAKA